MTMAIEILGYGGAIPAAVALAVFYLTRLFLPRAVADRWALASAMAAGFFAGYALLPEWAPLLPTQNWHWLPYLGLLAATGSAAAATEHGWSPRRWPVYLLLAAAAASLLAPTWPNLVPPRYVYILLLAAYLMAIGTLLDALPDRLLGAVFPLLLVAASASTAILIAATVSLKFGQLAGIAAAALVGCSVPALFGIRGGALRGLVPVYTVLTGGIAFAGAIEPEPPALNMLLAPAAPLALWLCAWGPAARLRGVAAWFAQSAVVLIPLIGLVLWIVLGREPEEW